MVHDFYTISNDDSGEKAEIEELLTEIIIDYLVLHCESRLEFLGCPLPTERHNLAGNRFRRLRVCHNARVVVGHHTCAQN